MPSAWKRIIIMEFTQNSYETSQFSVIQEITCPTAFRKGQLNIILVHPKPRKRSKDNSTGCCPFLPFATTHSVSYFRTKSLVVLRVELSARPTQPVHGRRKRIMNRSSWHRTWQNSRATTLGVTDTDAALPPINLAHPQGMESNKLKRERLVLNNAAQQNTFGLPWQSLTARSPSGKAKQRKQQYGNAFFLYLSSYVHRLHPSSLRSVYTVPAVLSIHGDEGLVYIQAPQKFFPLVASLFHCIGTHGSGEKRFSTRTWLRYLNFDCI